MVSPICIDPTVIAWHYIAYAKKPVTEKEIMQGVHRVARGLESSEFTVMGVEKSTPDIPHWNPDVVMGLSRLNNLHVIEIKETPSNEITYRKGKNMKDYEKRIVRLLGKEFHRNIIVIVKKNKVT